MAQDKRVFTGGMDKDSEPRLIKQGDYRDAKNIRNIASSDGTSGSVENIEGTQEVNYNFIEESETVVETIDEEFVEQEPVEVTFFHQDLIICYREMVNELYNFKIYSRVYGASSTGSTVEVTNGDFSWTGHPYGGPNNTSLSATYLLEQFGENGASSENIAIQSTTGESLTVHTEVYQGQFINYNNVINTGVPFPATLASGNPNCYIIRFVADVPGVEFQLDFESNYNLTWDGDNAISTMWSQTVSEPDYTLGWYSISNNQSGVNLFIMSQNGFEVSLMDADLVGEVVSEDGSPINNGNVFSGNSNITEVKMKITGLNPLTPQDPQNEFKIFSIIKLIFC